MRRYQIKWIDMKQGGVVRTVTYETVEEANVLLGYIEESPDLDLVDYRIIG